MSMTAKDIEQAAKIEAWAQEQVTRHRRECLNAPNCAGKKKIWWITRHSKTHEEIRNQNAVSYVLSLQCCELLEERLVRGVLGWLPDEHRLYRRRTPEDKYQLLGRPGFQETSGETKEVQKVSVRNFSDPEEVFLEVPEPPAQTSNRQRQTRVVANEPLDWVDSLTRRDR